MEKRCYNCRHFYDVWNDGTGKCAGAHGGITEADNGSECKAWQEDF